jgi:hypothetical protein
MSDDAPKRTRGAKFKVVGKFEYSREQVATVTIERERGLFIVRPLHGRREYTVTLASVAEMVVHKLLREEARP